MQFNSAMHVQVLTMPKQNLRHRIQRSPACYKLRNDNQQCYCNAADITHVATLHIKNFIPHDLHCDAQVLFTLFIN